MATDPTDFCCPKCGCRELFVTGVRIIFGGRKRRRRECRHCGKIIYTLEKIVESKDPPEPKHEPAPVAHSMPDPIPEPEPASPGAADGVFAPGFFDKKSTPRKVGKSRSKK